MLGMPGGMTPEQLAAISPEQYKTAMRVGAGPRRAPQNVGEGLTYMGEKIFDAVRFNKMMQAAQGQNAREASARTAFADAYAPAPQAGMAGGVQQEAAPQQEAPAPRPNLTSENLAPMEYPKEAPQIPPPSATERAAAPQITQGAGMAGGVVGPPVSQAGPSTAETPAQAQPPAGMAGGVQQNPRAAALAELQQRRSRLASSLQDPRMQTLEGRELFKQRVGEIQQIDQLMLQQNLQPPSADWAMTGDGRTQYNKRTGEVRRLEQGVEVPKGYTRDPKDPNRVVPIPGTKDDFERRKDRAGGFSEYNTAKTQIGDVQREIEWLTSPEQELSAGANFGIINSALPTVRQGTANWQVRFQRIANSAVIEALKGMRSPKTGATGFGALSEKELGVIQESLAALKTSQDWTQASGQLKSLSASLGQIVASKGREYEEIYGPLPEERGGGSGAPQAGGDGVPQVSSPEEAMALPSGTKFRAPDGSIRVRP